MMMSEFIERTGVDPTYEEYRYIEESYYEFDGNKDEFCKAWLKDKRDGHWEKELKLRMALAEKEAEHAQKISEMEETLNFYRPYFDRSRQFAKQLEEATAKLERLERVFRRVFDQEEKA
jgi:hypothetical protein